MPDPQNQPKLTICVYCSSKEEIDEAYKDLAGQVGTELARRGHALVWGGGRVSCMGAVARAARQGGARTVGVIPKALSTQELSDYEADELLITETMRERKGEMDRRADAFLTLPGGLGTLEELLEIWVSRSLGMHDKPLVVLDPDGFYEPLRQQVDALVERGFVSPGARDAIAWAKDVREAFDVLEREYARHARRVPQPDEVLEAET